MQRSRLMWIFPILAILVLWTSAPTHAAPLAAYSLPEGRTYDQAHNSGYIDWSGPVQYVYITHRDGSSLPPEEGGAYCGSGCSEWVTRLGNGGRASGSFDRTVSYFEVMVEFTPEGGVGTATLQACSASMSWYLYNNSSVPGYGGGTGLQGGGSIRLSLLVFNRFRWFRGFPLHRCRIQRTAQHSDSHAISNTHLYTDDHTHTHGDFYAQLDPDVDIHTDHDVHANGDLHQYTVPHTNPVAAANYRSRGL